jgi:hypothetical protein
MVPRSARLLRTEMNLWQFGMASPGFARGSGFCPRDSGGIPGIRDSEKRLSLGLGCSE